MRGCSYFTVSTPSAIKGEPAANRDRLAAGYPRVGMRKCRVQARYGTAMALREGY